MKYITVITLSILITSLSVSNSYSQHKNTKWLDGKWVGVGFQPEASSNNAWDICLNYNYSSKSIKITYPSFPCGGHWKLQEADKNKAVFIEYITTGKTKCQSNGKVIVTKIDDNFISVSYFYPGLADGVVSFSTLQRKMDGL
ncbi:MAG: hypothetical protein KAI79_08965 [Bacteroidales bacterium]|nr:hypothetical protein [Bacteroidales bacterium]